MRRQLLAYARPALLLLLSAVAINAAYLQTNLVSDLPGVAAHTDPNLQNPWGIASSAASPFWVADNGTGLSTLYNGSGTPNSLVVTIPPAAGGTPPSAPTGMVFNGTTDFNNSRFIFATEEGTIASWSSGTTATLSVDNSGSGAVYKGLALANNGAKNLLYAANFSAGSIDVFGPDFSQTTVSGGFLDPNIPAGFAPFNIQAIGGKLYVTYAEQDAAKEDDVAGAGNGYIDVFDTNGNFQGRLVSNGNLNSPWGIALAPATFGLYGGDLLVGNFGDGTINAFDPTSGAFLGVLTDANGVPIVNQGLWALKFGNGGQGGNTGTLYFTAGIPGRDNVEDHGLFAQLDAVPEPSTFLLVGAAFSVAALRRRKSA